MINGHLSIHSGIKTVNQRGSTRGVCVCVPVAGWRPVCPALQSVPGHWLALLWFPGSRPPGLLMSIQQVKRVCWLLI